VTRYSTMPVWLSVIILISSLSFIIWYFIIYPVRLQKKMNLQAVQEPAAIIA
jgi:hypothetical protein